MPRRYFQSGFAPILIIILIAIIGASAILIIKNMPFNQQSPASNTTVQSSNSADISSNPSPSPTISKTISQKLTPRVTITIKPTATNTPVPNNNSNSNNNSPTSTPTPAPNLTSAPTPTPAISYGTVKGTVKLIQPNGGVSLPLAGVSVDLTCDNCNTLYNGNVHAVSTDNNGNFVFNNVPSSTDIKLMALTYARWSDPININLTAGQTIIQDISVTLP